MVRRRSCAVRRGRHFKSPGMFAGERTCLDNQVAIVVRPRETPGCAQQRDLSTGGRLERWNHHRVALRPSEEKNIEAIGLPGKADVNTIQAFRRSPNPWPGPEN